MTFSALAGDRRLALGFYHASDGRKLRRYMARNGGRITAITNHGIVGDVSALQRELLKTSRTLSVNYGVGGGKVYGCVSENLKANTTSHSSDHYSVTLEIANGVAYPHPMTDEDFDLAARLNADICLRHGIVPSSSTINFHREFVATQCPGDHTWARRHEFIALVQKYLAQMRGEPAPSKPAPSKPAPAKTSSGLPAAGVAMLEGVGIGDVLRIRNWALYDDPGFTTSERFVDGDYRIVSITYKYRGGIEPSLQLQDSRGNRAWASYKAVAGVIGKGGGAPAKPKPAPARKSNEVLADEVLAGEWGNGAERERRLKAAGYSYAGVQAAVNARLRGSRPKAKSIADMAREVIAGEHGNGHTARRQSLGVSSATYAKVRAEVNRRVR